MTIMITIPSSRHPVIPSSPLHNLIIHQANAIQLVPTGDPILMDIVWPTWGASLPGSMGRIEKWMSKKWCPRFSHDKTQQKCQKCILVDFRWLFTEKLNRNGFEDDLKQQYQTLQRPKDPKMVSVSHLIHSHNLAEMEMMCLCRQYHYPGEWPAIDIQRIIAVEAMIYHAAPAWSFQNFHGWAMSSPSFCLAFPYQFSTLRPPVSSNMACCKKSTMYRVYFPSKPPFSAGISQLAIFWWHRCVPVLSHPQIQTKEFQLGAVGKHALLGHSSGPGPLKVKWLILPTIVVIHSPQLMRG